MLIISLAIVALLLSTNWLLISAKEIGALLGVKDYAMGLVLVALATTIPELTVEIRAIIRGATGIAFGDILGSVVANSSLVLGIAAVLQEITYEPFAFINAAFFMVTSVYIAMLFIKKKEITWQEGIGVLMLYVTFLITEGLAIL
jgi:cation:H+ antiporter